MRISFSMDGIKSIDKLYTYTKEQTPEFGECEVEHYHGKEYCQNVISDVMQVLSSSDWKGLTYSGCRERIANETFKLTGCDDSEYTVVFSINTYERKAARMEVSVRYPDTESLDQRLESLKIALKNRLLGEWSQCTWLVDEQAAALCKESYEKAFTVENNLRAFASKVLIHFLGIDWLKRAGLEKEAESVATLKDKFIQRVPEFDNINTDFLSMTLETLMGVILDGIIYSDNIVISRQNYESIQRILDAKQTKTGSGVGEYLKKLRTKEKNIWDDLFVKYIDDPADFKTTVHDFIEDRNHVAHSKVLSLNAFRVFKSDFEKMNALILAADAKFEREETSDEMIQTWEYEHENDEYERDYLRERIVGETGIDILDESDIEDWFYEVLHSVYNSVYQKYHLDVCRELSDFYTKDEDEILFTISCPAVEDMQARIDIRADFNIDDDLGEDSTCHITAINAEGIRICSADIRYHNGNAVEVENSFMEATEDSVYDTSEIEDFLGDLFDAIEELNPYIQQLYCLVLENGGEGEYTANLPCEQCGNYGVSINEEFLTVGRCCYCGYEHELKRCTRCGELVNEDDMEAGFCPNCASYIDKQ